MKDYEAATYGESWAEIYDDTPPAPADVTATVDILAELAAGGPVLELAIGTGRVALPLAARGVRVEGIDVSRRMVDRLRAKPGGETLQVSISDFAEVDVEGRFRLIYVVFNTFYALLGQDDQVRCFRNVAEHLTDDGAFLIEAFVPDLARFDRGQRVDALEVGIHKVHLVAARHDQANQRVDVTRVVLSEAGMKLYPVALRYVWPAELDLMAQLAGLQLQHRWSGWQKEPFGSDSGSHVSVYGSRVPVGEHR